MSCNIHGHITSFTGIVVQYYKSCIKANCSSVKRLHYLQVDKGTENLKPKYNNNRKFKTEI